VEPTTRTLLDTLVGMDTTSARSNLDLVAFVESLLDEHGVPHERVPSPDGTKANLLARIGPDVAGGVVLTGHTDCVPVTGQPWSRDPFVVHEADGRLYGRGVADMKGFLAVVLAGLPALCAADLARPVLLALTYDEEVGTVGAPSAVERLAAAYPPPSAVIVGEPTSMGVVTAHKGVRAYTTTVDGLDGHSSRPDLAANAVTAAARIAAFIDDLAEDRRADPTHHDDRFEPPYTTFNLATFSGGQAINIVPRRAELTWEYRPVPADDGEALREAVDRFVAAEVLPRLRRDTGTGDVRSVPDAVARTLAHEPDGAAEALVRALTGDDAPAGTVAFGTDGGHFQAAGWSTVVCGPGDIAQAHQPDEWIAVDQLTACERFVAALTDHLAR
jgi:acetylornithine deacetylase